MRRAVRPELLAALLALACAGHRQAAPAAQAPAAAPAPAAPPAAEAPAAAEAAPRTVPPLGPLPPLRLPEQHHFRLANGLAVRLVEEHRLPIVALSLVVDAGAARDPAARPGLASFTAAMLTEGTATRSATRISDEVGFLGASLGATAGPDSATLSASVLSHHLPRLLAIFADVAMNPAFGKDDFARVQDERQVLLLQQRDQPPIVAAKAFAAEFWGSHPYGHPVIGTEAGLAAIRPADLTAFHGALWRPANAELVVVGDVTEAQLRPILERTLGGWKRGKRAPALPARPPAAPHRTIVVEKSGASQSYLLLGSPGLDRRSPDYVATTVLFQLLGSGTNSRLFRTLREAKGYTYGMGAGMDARRLGGGAIIHGSVKAEVTGPALKDLLAELERLREEPVPAHELEDAKEGIIRSLPADFSTVGDIAARLSDLALHGLPDDYWNTYAGAVAQVTPADLERVARRYLDPDHTTLVLVGPPGVATTQLVDLPIGTVERRVSPGPGLLPRKRAPVSKPAGTSLTP